MHCHGRSNHMSFRVTRNTPVQSYSQSTFAFVIVQNCQTSTPAASRNNEALIEKFYKPILSWMQPYFPTMDLFNTFQVLSLSVSVMILEIMT